MLLTAVNEKLSQNLPVRLHLGCGPRLFDGYINIDGDYMKDHPGIIIHDISKKFDLPDNIVDEILTVHVIEHIMPDQVFSMLAEWRRILKPGGIVAIEWPDLLKMCKFLVDDPSRFYSKDKRVLKRGIAGIFGNIARYQDMSMLHKWGYSIDSLSVMLTEVGFNPVMSEPNKHPKTEMCSRVVGFKN